MPKELALQFTAGAMAGIVAETGTHPLDCLKTMIQLQEHKASLRLHVVDATKLAVEVAKAAPTTTISAPEYRGLLQTGLGIVHEQGFKQLYVGLPPALVRQLVKAGCQMPVYQYIKDRLKPDDQKASKKMPLHLRITAAASAGMFGQIIANPCDVIKVRLQADGQRMLLNQPRRYNGPVDAIRHIYVDKGIRGFWRGTVPSMERAAVNAGAGLASYDHFKYILVHDMGFKDGPIIHSCISVFSAMTATLCALPFDVVKTRIMNQSLTNPVYSSSFDCVRQTVANEGVLSLWKGFVPTYMRVFPWQFLFYLSYEQFSKQLLGRSL